MDVDNTTGWLRNVRRVVSPHCGVRPAGATLDLIVVHGISLPPGEFGGPWIDDLFAGRLDTTAHPAFASLQGLRVSAHIMISRVGVVTQYVSFAACAWHAGRSSWRDREHCNDFSVGIELEGTDDIPYEAAQYRQLAALIQSLSGAYRSLRDADVVGHADVAPGRKTDPGAAFDWDHLSGLLGRKLR